MLIDNLDKTARERLGAIVERVEGLSVTLDEKNALMGHLLGVKDVLPTLDVQGLEFLNRTLGKILDMLLHQQGMVMLEPITGLFLTALKFLHGGQDPGREVRPGRGLETGR